MGFCVVFFWRGVTPEVGAQLAITEVMSFGSTNGLAGGGLVRPDFWELTNFGTNAIDLSGYKWFDADNVEVASRKSFPQTSIGPGKSIIFVRGNSVIPNATVFREWWGTNLPSDLQVYFPTGAPGFDDEQGDAVRLWDADGRLVDEARFGSAQRGVTFTYNTNSGAFTEFSKEGVAGAFRAAQGGDIGSPGYASKGPVSLRFTQQPVSRTNDAGSEVVLKVMAMGRPGPRYQWYHNGTPVQNVACQIAMPTLVGLAGCGPSWRRCPAPNDLVLSDIRAEQAGEYFVEIFNGLERHTSAVVTVTVNNVSSPIRVECSPDDLCVSCGMTSPVASLEATPGQTALLSVRNLGFPPPTFQWSHSQDGANFADLSGQTHRDLSLVGVQVGNAGYYRVRMQNELGVIDALIRLAVKPPPKLLITEVMSQVCSTPNRGDWWELTNTGNEPVNLCGYRWDDETARSGDVITPGGGPTITNGVVLEPGESILLLESQTSASFNQWWGASNLPPRQKFIAYSANGLGFERGDSIYLWHPNETDGLNWVHSVVFSGGEAGKTFWFDFEDCVFSELGVPSVKGDCGAVRAENGCEIGSPGWTRWTPPQMTSVQREGQNVRLSWRAQPGSLNRLQFTRALASPPAVTQWEEVGTFWFASAACEATESSVGDDLQRFYRVVRVAAAACPCPDPVEFSTP